MADVEPPPPCPPVYRVLRCPKCRRELFDVYLDHHNDTYIIYNGKPEKEVRRILCSACVTYRKFRSLHVDGQCEPEIEQPENNDYPPVDT